jgi:hypothetical protein
VSICSNRRFSASTYPVNTSNDHRFTPFVLLLLLLLSFMLYPQAPAGQPPDVWCRFPDELHTLDDISSDDDVVNELYEDFEGIFHV